MVYEGLYVPDKIKDLYPDKDSITTGVADYKDIIMKELREDKKLLKAGEGDSSGGSDSEPSEDNMPIEEIAKVVPIVEKSAIKKLEKVLNKKKKEEEEKEKEKQKEDLGKQPKSQPP